jgi:cytoplasmic iron level regulating protein YaaA (DUF328/UPF0246 family)
MGKNIYLVQCSKTKREFPSPAQYLYTSDLFKKSSAYSKKHADKWFILSALHHLVHPDQTLDYYNVTLKDKFRSQRRDWAVQVFSTLKSQISPGDKIVFLAGELYSEFLLPLLVKNGWEVECPMEGLPIGKKLHWLKKHLEEE